MAHPIRAKLRSCARALFALSAALALAAAWGAGPPSGHSQAGVELGERPRPPAGSDLEAEPDQIVVRFRAGAPALAIQALNDANSALGSEAQPRSGLYRVSLPQGADIEAALAAYRRSPLVEEAGPNLIARALEVPDDTNYSYQWHLHDTVGGIRAESAWDLSATKGAGVIVAVIDTGVAYEDFTGPGGLSTQTFVQAPDLASNTFVDPWDFYNNDAHANDDNGHGTHVAGTIGQDTNNAYGVAGVAYNATIMPVKALAFDGTGFSDDINEAIYYAADHGADVINMSIGFAGTGAPDGNGTVCTEVVGLGAALDYAYANGVVVVASSGNEGATTVSCPAAYPTVIAVGATRFDGAVASYSNTGSALDVTAPGGDSVDQNGDGFSDGVVQETFCYDWVTLLFMGTYDTYCDMFYTGTSMAAPHVAGVAALLLGEDPSLTPDDVRARLEQTARDRGAGGWDSSYGWGVVDASAALTGQAVDLDPPTASITAPLDGATVSGVVNIAVDATDPSGIEKVRFWAGTTYLGYDWLWPYERPWDTTGLPNGPITIKIEAKDLAGNSTVAWIGVNLQNADATPPTATITAPLAGATVSETISIDADASDAGGVEKVRFWVDGTYLGYDWLWPYSKSWDTTAFANGPHTIKIQAIDWAGNSTFEAIAVIVSNADVTPPSLTITAPADGATVSGAIDITADASDAGGVHKLRFWVDGVYLGYDWLWPYSKPWDTTAFADGAHTVRVVAIDWAGNTTEQTVSVNIANGGP